MCECNKEKNKPVPAVVNSESITSNFLKVYIFLLFTYCIDEK